jgi:hypothetical protein
MGLIWITEANQEESSEELKRTTHTRYFKAKTGVNDSWQVILRARPDLARYQPHPNDGKAFVNRINPVRIGLGFWELSIEYSTEVEGDTKENPLNRPAEVTIDNQPRERVRTRDRHGRPIVNTAGDPFDDPPPVETINHLLFVIEKNIPTAFQPWILRYTEAVNSDVVRLRGLSLAPNTLRTQKLTIGKEDRQNDVDFCVLHLELEFAPETWTTWIPNRGHYELIYDRNAIRPNNLRNRKALTPLDKREILIDGAVPKDPQWLDRFGRYVEKPWLEASPDPNSKPVKLKPWESIPPRGIVFLPFDLPPSLPFNRLPIR